jgi:hypothetical protein
LQQIFRATEVIFRTITALVNTHTVAPNVQLNNVIVLTLTRWQHLLVFTSISGAKRALSQQHGAPVMLINSLLGSLSLLATTLLLVSMIPTFT